jgi:hypothetical protein
MSKAKKLNLTLPELIEIAKAINKNTLANRNKSADEKINTDIFIKQFGINRKDFSETIKNTTIKYNKSTFQYDIESPNNNSETLVATSKPLQNNKGDTLVAPDEYTKGETIVTLKENNKSETVVVKAEAIGSNVVIVEFENMKSELMEMLEWYKTQRKKENIIDIEIPIISIDKEKLTEAAVTRGFKIYPNVVSEFKEFCNQNSQYNMQDLMAMALVEYMDKYKK